MKVEIEGYDMPGRVYGLPDGSALHDVRVGVQVRKDPDQLVPGDAANPIWTIEIEVLTDEIGVVDFKGAAVHGKRGDRFVYLTWGNGDGDQFEMFQRAKLMLNRIAPAIVKAADKPDQKLVARIQMSDEIGRPRCARVDPPAIEWAAAGNSGSLAGAWIEE